MFFYIFNKCKRKNHLIKNRLTITVGHWTMSDQNQKLSSQMKNIPDILSDRKNSSQN